MARYHLLLVCAAAWAGLTAAAAVEDLVAKAIANDPDSLAQSSSLCCGHFLPVNAEYDPADLAPYSLPQGGGCMSAGNGSLPFVWVPPEIDPFLYLQLDFRLAHRLTEVRRLAVHELPDWTVTSALCQFSVDGEEWTEAIGCGCVTSVDQLARFLRLYIVTAPANMAALSLVVLGEEVVDYAGFAKVQNSEICPGYQTRLDMELTSPDVADVADWCGTVDITITRDGTPVYPSSAAGFAKIQHALQVKVEEIEVYDKCMISFTLEAFQSDFNGVYSVTASPPGKDSISEDSTLEIMDTGEPNDHFYIEIPSGGFYVAVAPYTAAALDKNEMTSSCGTNRRGAVVLTPNDVIAFQSGGTNRFIQTVIYHHQGAPIGTDVEGEKYLLLEDNVNARCASVNATSGDLSVTDCDVTDTLAGVMCLLTRGECTALQMQPVGCVVQSDTQQVEVTLLVTGTIIGAGISRDVTCEAVTLTKVPVRSTRQTLSISKTTGDHFVAVMEAGVQWYGVQCFLERKDGSNVVITRGFHEIPRFETPIVVRGAVHNRIYPTQGDYYRAYQVIMDTFGFPMNNFVFQYTPWTFDNSRDPKRGTGISTSMEFACNSSSFEPYINAVGIKNFPYFEPKETGLYEFFIGQKLNDDYGTDLIRGEFAELIHPFSITCSDTCIHDFLIGQNLKINCTVDHHFAVASYAPHEWPFHIHLLKSEHDPLFIDGNYINMSHMNPCEYSIPLETNPIEVNSRYSSMDVDKRQVYFEFEIYSVQTWNLGDYFVYFNLSRTEDRCYYQSQSETCLELWEVPGSGGNCTGPRVNEHNYLFLTIETNQVIGTPAPNEDQICHGNARSIYLSDPLNPLVQTPFFYRICATSSALEEYPFQFCQHDGGEIVFPFDDGLGRALADGALTNPSDIRYKVYGVNNIFRSLTCNGFTVFGGVSDMVSLFFRVGIHGSLSTEVYRYLSGKLAREPGLPPDASVVGTLCRYRLAYVWNMYQEDTSACNYKPLDMSRGQVQRVHVQIHGDLPVTVQCEAVDPPGAKPNVTFPNVDVHTGIDYLVSYPDEPAVTLFKCYQVYDERHPWYPDTKFGRAFTFRFTSKPLELNVDERLEVRTERLPGAPTEEPASTADPDRLDPVWCFPEDALFKQPCYGRRAQIRCCVQGNPIQNCSWVRLENPRPLASDPLISTDFTRPAQQCDDTTSCSTITFAELTKDHDGYYSCVCTNGLEETIPTMTGRPQTQYLPLVPHQSAIQGERDFSFFVECDPPRFFGRSVLIGQSINATVTCHSGDSSWRELPANNSVIRPGLNLIQFALESPTRETVCQFNGSNSFANEPLIFEGDLEKEIVIHSLIIENVTNDSGPEISICCDICAFGVDDTRFRLFCEDPSKNLLEFGASSFEYDESTFQGRQCGTLSQAHDVTVLCSCQFAQHESTAVFYANGNLEVSNMAPIVAPAPENITAPQVQFTTMANLGGGFSLQETTPLRFSTEKLYPATVNILAEDIDLAQALSEIKYFATKHKGEVVGFEILESIELAADSSDHSELSQGRVDKILTSFEHLRAKTYTTNETVETKGKSREMALAMSQQAARLMQNVMTYDARFDSDERASIAAMWQLELTLHHLGRELQAVDSLDFATGLDHMVVHVTKLGGHSAAVQGSASVYSNMLDMEGVTRHTKQGALIEPEVAANLPAGSTLLLLTADDSVIPPEKQVLPKLESQNTIGRAETRGFERVADIILASGQTAGGESLGDNLVVNYSLNYYRSYPKRTIQGVFETLAEIKCVFFDDESNSYSTTGMEPVLIEDTRGSCRALHATPLSLAADVTMIKRDPVEKVEHYWVAWFCLAGASVLVNLTFMALMYLHDELEDVPNIMRLSLLVALQVYICTYLAGADKVNLSGVCTTTQLVLHISAMASLCAVLNIILTAFYDVTPSLWRKELWGFVYSVIMLPVPLAIAFLGLPGSWSLIQKNYSCFLSPTSVNTIFFYYVMVGALVTATLVVGRLTNRNAEKLADDTLAEEIPLYISQAINNTSCLAIVMCAVFTLGCVAMGHESFGLHAAFGASVLLLALLVMYTLVFRSPEVEDAWHAKHTMTLPRPTKKRRVHRKRVKREKKYVAGGGETAVAAAGEERTTEDGNSSFGYSRFESEEESALSTVSNSLFDSRPTSVRSAGANHVTDAHVECLDTADEVADALDTEGEVNVDAMPRSGQSPAVWRAPATRPPVWPTLDILWHSPDQRLSPSVLLSGAIRPVWSTLRGPWARSESSHGNYDTISHV